MNKILILLLSLFTGRLSAQQCVNIDNCPINPLSFCNMIPNSPLFWNEPYWTDAAGLYDLGEVETALSLKATNFCPGQTLSFRYLLFLDTNNDGIRETVVNSAGLPGFNTVNFNNAGNPGYTGGTPQAFDERPVAANQKYGFALQETVSGTSRTGYVKWNTQASPDTYVDAQMPVGRHRIKWFVTSNLGEERTCEYDFNVKKDCFLPTVVCLNGVSVNILPTLSIEMFSVDFMQYMQDNVTPANLLQTGLRKSGTGTGFPMDSAGNPINSIIYDCSELGTQLVELWARDQAGNADFCETYVIVQDNIQVCLLGAGQPGEDVKAVVAPNPFSDVLRLNVQSRQAAVLSVRLTDQAGRELLRSTEEIGAGDRTIELPAASLPAGFYFLWIEDSNGARHVEKVVKQ